MLRATRFSGSLLLVLFSLFAVSRAHAQDDYTRFELGAQYSLIRETNAALNGISFSGIGARFNCNLTRRLAFELQIDFFPENGVPLVHFQGGQTTQAVFGLRAKVIQTRRLSVFGLVRPGLLHFSAVQVLAPGSGNTYTQAPGTYFVLNLGGGLEYYASPRWVFRADIQGDPYRIPAFFSGGATLPGKINDTTRLSFGVAYRPGALIKNEPEINVSGKWESGPLFSSMTLARQGPADNVVTQPGVGGYFSYRFYGVFYADSDLLYFPTHPTLSGPQTGGALLQGLFGLKGGIRRNQFGFFGKVRPGFDSFSAALTGITNNQSAPVFTYARSNNFALDLGGIVEFYPSDHSTLRVEIGDTHLFYATRYVDVNGSTQPVAGGKMQHSIQLMLGYGWRF